MQQEGNVTTASGTVTTPKQDKLTISWFSNAPWASTGYGNQTRLFVPRIKALGHDISITAFYGLEGGVMDWNGIRVFPRAKNSYGLDIVSAAALQAGAQIVITLIDAWIFDPRTIALPWFPWFPVDHEPMPRDVLEKVRGARRGIVYSKFAQQQAEFVGLDPYYVPHGIDTKAFCPVDRAMARSNVKLPEDAFIVGMVAANKGVPPRKSFFEQITAFAMLRKKHKDAILYLHTEPGNMRHPEQVNLVDFCHTIGLIPGKNVFFPDAYNMTLGFSDLYMRDMYNALDVLMNAAKGEGFGIPIIEAQACGTPVITGNWTAQGELCLSGWKISKEEAEQEYDPYFNSFWYRVKAGAVYERLEAAYTMRGNQDYRTRAREGALEYDADRVTAKYWKPVLADIAEKLHEQPPSDTQ